MYAISDENDFFTQFSLRTNVHYSKNDTGDTNGFLWGVNYLCYLCLISATYFHHFDI